MREGMMESLTGTRTWWLAAVITLVAAVLGPAGSARPFTNAAVEKRLTTPTGRTTTMRADVLVNSRTGASGDTRLARHFSPVNLTGTGPDRWKGVYKYEEGIGRVSGGVKAFVVYTIRINSGQAKLGAVMRVMGYQTDETLRCDTATRSDGMYVFFNSYPNGGIKNKYGVALYRKGALLLSLHWIDDRRYKARWVKYRPHRPSGRAVFKKIR
jgi:hypothetical protein